MIWLWHVQWLMWLSLQLVHRYPQHTDTHLYIHTTIALFWHVLHLSSHGVLQFQFAATDVSLLHGVYHGLCRIAGTSAVLCCVAHQPACRQQVPDSSGSIVTLHTILCLRHISVVNAYYSMHCLSHCDAKSCSHVHVPQCRHVHALCDNMSTCGVPRHVCNMVLQAHVYDMELKHVSVMF